MFRHLKSLDEGSVAFRRHRDAIVKQALPIADHIARRFKNRGEPLDDLVQAARLGLVNAVTRFDVDAGSDFLAFAVPTVTGEVRRHFRDHGWAVKVPRRLKDLQKHLVQARAELSQRLCRAPTASELADHLDLDRELVIQAFIAGSNYTTRSTDVPFGTEGESPSPAERFGVIDDNLENVLNAETIRSLIASLPERLRTVLMLRFFENLTQTEIAERIGCSQMHVSRLVTQALCTLRGRISQPDHAAA